MLEIILSYMKFNNVGCSPQGHRELDTTEQAHKTEAKLPEWGSAVCRAEPASRAGAKAKARVLECKSGQHGATEFLQCTHPAS